MAAAATQLQPQLVKEQPRPKSKGKAKPKFDIPVEAAPAEASNGWVYRAEAASAAPAPAAASVAVAEPRAEMPTKQETASDPFGMIGEGVYLISLGSLRLMYQAASGLITAPFRLVSTLLD